MCHGFTYDTWDEDKQRCHEHIAKTFYASLMAAEGKVREREAVKYEPKNPEWSTLHEMDMSTSKKNSYGVLLSYAAYVRSLTTYVHRTLKKRTIR